MPVKRAALVGVALAGLAAGEARAQGVWTFYSGNDLLALCVGADLVGQALCLGFAAGVADTLGGVSERGGNYAGYRTCLPSGITAGQARDIVVQHLRAHPEDRSSSAVTLTARALEEAFRCR